MAALLPLRATVVKASPVDDNSTYKYHIKLQFESATWEVAKRFSEFDTLLQSLGSCKYGALPRLPSKTLLGSPTAEEVIAGRKEQLRIILNDLLGRPDTRTSQQVRSFLALDSHTGTAVRSLLPEALRTFEDPRFGVSDFCVSPGSNLILITHEDSTHLSRLGRVWSVVEPDELGAVHLWSQAGESWKRMYSHTYGIKVRSLAWEEQSRHLFVGLEDGKIEVFDVPADTMQPAKKASLELHHKSPVTHLSVSPRRLLSLGFDTAVRVIDTTSRALLCGGRLMKRLRSESDYLSCGILDDAQDRAFIGTSGGDVFILDISRNPPNFLHTLQFGSHSVAKMCRYKDRFFVAVADSIVVMSFEEKGKEENTSKLGTYRCKYLPEDEVSILSVAAAPERKLIFGGYSDGSVAVWRERQHEAIIVLRAHSNDVTQLAWSGAPPWGPALFSGGGDGKVTTWLLSGSDEDLTMWSPQGIHSASAADAFDAALLGTPYCDTSAFNSGAGAAAPAVDPDGLSAFEPTFGVGASSAGGNDGGDVFSLSSSKVNPQALRGAGDSDSEDDIANAFR
mmetsp:Transcript_34005/g.97980  ORF Transcript_34005/g.97980 Transcript_34005/m.97980 type:complete len:564 (+) Transcript_34005:151-1842(+)